MVETGHARALPFTEGKDGKPAAMAGASTAGGGAFAVDALAGDSRCSSMSASGGRSELDGEEGLPRVVGRRGLARRRGRGRRMSDGGGFETRRGRRCRRRCWRVGWRADARGQGHDPRGPEGPASWRTAPTSRRAKLQCCSRRRLAPGRRGWRAARPTQHAGAQRRADDFRPAAGTPLRRRAGRDAKVQGTGFDTLTSKSPPYTVNAQGSWYMEGSSAHAPR